MKANALVYSLTENEKEINKSQSNAITSAAITVRHLKMILWVLPIRIALTTENPEF